MITVVLHLSLRREDLAFEMWEGRLVLDLYLLLSSEEQVSGDGLSERSPA